MGNKNLARQKLGLPIDVPIVVSVGYVEPRKGFHDLIPAFQKVVARYPKALLVIVGGACKARKSIPDKD